jgi:hypothetical protein
VGRDATIEILNRPGEHRDGQAGRRQRAGPVAPDLASVVAAWRGRERAAGMSGAASGWSAGCASERRPGSGDTG